MHATARQALNSQAASQTASQLSTTTPDDSSQVSANTASTEAESTQTENFSYNGQ